VFLSTSVTEVTDRSRFRSYKFTSEVAVANSARWKVDFGQRNPQEGLMESNRPVATAMCGFMTHNCRGLIFAAIGAAAFLGTIVAFAAPRSLNGFDTEIANHAQAMIEEGRRPFALTLSAARPFGATHFNCKRRSRARETEESARVFRRRLRYQSASKWTPTHCRTL
jgi:hypothetical protein